MPLMTTRHNSECRREADSCMPFKTLPMPPPTVVTEAGVTGDNEGLEPHFRVHARVLLSNSARSLFRRKPCAFMAQMRSADLVWKCLELGVDQT